MNFIKSEINKEFQSVGFKNKRKNLRELPQRGKTTVVVDQVKKALLPGKRISVNGKEYWETRKNRSDKKGSRV